MGWFDSTNAILGIRGMEQQKKNDRWSKLMDIASLLQSTAGMGADLWKTVSGRKHDFALASVGQGYAVDTREDTQAHDLAMASTSQGYAQDRFGWQAKFDADEAGKDRDWRATQNELDRALDRQLSAASISAQMGDRSEQRMSFLAEWAQRAYELAVSNQSFLGPDGMFDPAKRESLRKFLYTQVEGLPNLSNEEIAWAKTSFDGFVDGLGAAPNAPAVAAGTVTTPPGRTDLLTSAKDMVSKLAGVTLPPAEQKVVDDAANMLSRPPSGGGGVYDVQGLLSKLQTIYNTWKYRGASGSTGQLSDDLRVTK